MKAMILAAGKGTRLRPFTDSKPKALAEVGGLPLLQIVLGRLREAGVSDVVINLHHFGEQIEAWVAQHRAKLGLQIAFSRESGELLDTGGGLKHAGWFFEERCDAPARSFLLHNVDVLSDIDLAGVMRAHDGSGALATVVAMERPTARPLLFDTEGWLCGRVTRDGDRVVRSPVGALQRLGFCGIHAIAPALLPRLTENGAFSIVDSYLRLAAEGAPVRVFRADGAKWRDAGRPENLAPL